MTTTMITSITTTMKTVRNAAAAMTTIMIMSIITIMKTVMNAAAVIITMTMVITMQMMYSQAGARKHPVPIPRKKLLRLWNLWRMQKLTA